jgi:uncharacterized protein with PIN domain
MPPQPKFAVDEMLGSLARWLRIMGYDTTYKKDQGDNEILRSSKEEGRILLTRDEELAARGAPLSLYILSDDIDQQLGQVANAFELVANEDMVRCTMCNGELELVPKEELNDKVPKGALENNQEFFRCKSCGKIYWKGSHWNNIRKRLESLHLMNGQVR